MSKTIKLTNNMTIETIEFNKLPKEVKKQLLEKWNTQLTLEHKQMGLNPPTGLQLLDNSSYQIASNFFSNIKGNYVVLSVEEILWT